MELTLTVTRYLKENGNVVVTLTPTLTNTRTGDKVSGSVIITTTADNAVLIDGDAITVDLTTDEVTP